MLPEKSVENFHDFATLNDLLVSELTPRQTVQLMVDFYLKQRCSSCCPFEDDGDMLLFQYGVYNWGAGANFEFNITRQFIFDDNDSEQVISQFLLTLYFTPDEELQAIKPTNNWCGSPDDIDKFLDFIKATNVVEMLEAKNAERVTLWWEVT